MSFIYSEVQKLKEKYLTNDPFDIMRQEGIIVRHCYEFTHLKGYYCLSNGFRYAGINGNLEKQMRKVVGGHELGHDILHRHIAESGPLHDVFLYSAASGIEREANDFSANLLISDDEIMEHVESGFDYYGLSSILGYPLEIIQIKLNDMRLRGYKLNISDIPDSQFLK
ncbi:ImmA/IrrE family metallo-endopeptidase [Christensenellaceae bacterium OttesenSCG-928-K19]|nr:ImmA/IrrE family metallo-endopeptidase [Christensenellaceae bacterium OttesenSCG-928-K19]